MQEHVSAPVRKQNKRKIFEATRHAIPMGVAANEIGSQSQKVTHIAIFCSEFIIIVVYDLILDDLLLFMFVENHPKCSRKEKKTNSWTICP